MEVNMKILITILAIFFLTASALAIVTTCGEASQCGGNGGAGGRGGTGASCTVSTICYVNSQNTGSVSCTSAQNDCKRGSTWVACDKVTTWC